MNRAAQSCLAVMCVVCLSGADWLQFRGSDANGVAAESSPPTNLETEAWSAELSGRGLSGPIVVDGRVVVTSSSGYQQDRLHVVCFDDATGEQLWERQFWATGRTMCHAKMCVATPTPASDGERIFAFYSSNDLACLDLDGNLLWYRGLTHDFPNASNSLGMASSPVVVGDTVIAQVESDAEAFAVGLDVETGLSRWQLERPRAANWTSPSILRGAAAKDDLAVLQSSKGLAAVAPLTGDIVWTYDESSSTIPSLTISNGRVFVPSDGIAALRPTIPGSAPEIIWQNAALKMGSASPLAYQGYVYTLNRAGVLTATDEQSGDVAWKLRLRGGFSSSPIAGGGHLYLFNEEGVAFVVSSDEKKGSIVAERELGETIMCTPAIAANAIYVRSDGRLWKFAN